MRSREAGEGEAFGYKTFGFQYELSPMREEEEGEAFGYKTFGF
jgi:hypothetical protein